MFAASNGTLSSCAPRVLFASPMESAPSALLRLAQPPTLLESHPCARSQRKSHGITSLQKTGGWGVPRRERVPAKCSFAALKKSGASAVRASEGLPARGAFAVSEVERKSPARGAFAARRSAKVPLKSAEAPGKGRSAG